MQVIGQIAKNIDEKYFEEIFREYFIPLTSFAGKYTRDLDEAKDIVHQVFGNLWEKRKDLHVETSIRSYLFTSVHNRCLNYIRDNKKFVEAGLPDGESNLYAYIDHEDYLENEELRNRIHQALDQLPEKCRRIFVLSRFEEKKYREIASELDISIKTVETQMSKALKILKEKLADYLGIIALLMIFFIKIFE